MKSYKPILLTAALFLTLISTIFYTACEKNPCNNVVCYNGGSCNNGVCRCPTGYEGAQCAFRSIDRFVGSYGGFKSCNDGVVNSAYFIDTVVITADNGGANRVFVALKSISPKVLTGYVRNSESAYTIVVTNNDSTRVGSVSYLRAFDLTLQDDKNLTLHTYEKNIVVVPAPDTTVSNCTFVGVKD